MNIDLSFNTLLPSLLVLPLGFGLGIFYFTSLWFTVKKITQSKYPVVLMVTSGAARLIVALVTFYLMIGGHWERLLIAMIGFWIARTILIARWRPQTSLNDLLLEE